MDMMTTKVFKMVHPMAIPIEVQGCHIVNTQAVIEFLQTLPIAYGLKIAKNVSYCHNRFWMGTFSEKISNS